MSKYEIVIVDYNTGNVDSLEALLKCLKITNPTSNASEDNFKFSGLQIVITGKIPSMSRDEIKTLLLLEGAKVTSSISKKTDYLIAGENAGSKLVKAKTLNVKIINTNEINNFLNDPKKIL